MKGITFLVGALFASDNLFQSQFEDSIFRQLFLRKLLSDFVEISLLIILDKVPLGFFSHA